MNKYLDILKNNFKIRSLTFTAICIEILLLLYPINSGFLKFLFFCLTSLILIGLTISIWKNKILRWLPSIVPAIILSILILPGKEINKKQLGEFYITSLRSYEGVPYVWGGENALGIDCSGLVRKAFIYANLKEAIHNLNPETFREALKLWLNDTSAKGLANGYNGKTCIISSAKNLNDLDLSSLPAGLMAVTKDGVHVMSYLGNREWIEADPGVGKVIIVKPPTTNEWFQQAVQLVEWIQLH